VAGEPRVVELQLDAGGLGTTIFKRSFRARQLYLGQGAHGLPRSYFHQRRRTRTRHRHVPRAAESEQPQGGAGTGDLPFGRNRRFGQSWSGVADALLGGWQLSGIHTIQGGLGLTATLGGGAVLGLGGERRARPDLVGNPVLPGSQRTVQRWFNTDAFAVFNPAPQAFGNAGVGIMRGPEYINFDFNLAKNFRIDEQRSMQFRTEFFNAFNHANFNPPDIRRDATTFGQILSAQNARILQFALKLYF
jgi:hypothetical protein